MTTIDTSNHHLYRLSHALSYDKYNIDNKFFFNSSGTVFGVYTPFMMVWYTEKEEVTTQTSEDRWFNLDSTCLKHLNLKKNDTCVTILITVDDDADPKMAAIERMHKGAMFKYEVPISNSSLNITNYINRVYSDSFNGKFTAIYYDQIALIGKITDPNDPKVHHYFQPKFMGDNLFKNAMYLNGKPNFEEPYILLMGFRE